MSDRTYTKPPRSQRSAFIGPAIALGVAVLIGLAIYFAETSPFVADPAGDNTQDVRRNSELDARPVGAGTNADGLVDETREGLGNETSTADFLNQSEATDRNGPLLDTGRSAPEPATSAEGLTPLGSDTPILGEIPGAQIDEN